MFIFASVYVFPFVLIINAAFLCGQNKKKYKTKNKTKKQNQYKKKKVPCPLLCSLPGFGSSNISMFT